MCTNFKDLAFGVLTLTALLMGGCEHGWLTGLPFEDGAPMGGMPDEGPPPGPMFHDQCAAGELPVLGLISFAITVHDTPEVHNDGLFVNIRLGVDSMLAAIAMGKIPEHNGGYLALGYAYDVVYMVRQAGLNWLNLNEGVLMTQVPDPTGETYITVMRNGFTGAVEMFLVVDSITGEAIAVSYGPDSVNDRNLHNRGRSRQRCAEMI